MKGFKRHNNSGLEKIESALPGVYQELFKGYHPLPGVYDEYFNRGGSVSSEMDRVIHFFDQFSSKEFASLHQNIQDLFKKRGVTFNLYSDGQKTERIFPFDLLPRLIPKEDWKVIERGLKQRIRALNEFLLDVYGKQKILQAHPFLRDIVFSCKGYLPQLQGIVPPGNVFIHVAGSDIIRVGDHDFMILEDNLKVPSGVSYVLENRRMMQEYFFPLFHQVAVQDVDDFPSRLREMLCSVASKANQEMPFLVVLTPGSYNSAYFEHLYLARHMGCPLVENSDLVVIEDRVYLKTSEGLQSVDIIYRRTDDEFLDPKVFHPDSLLGIPGLVGAYRAGNVVLANALGNGVADDKAIYAYVPLMIRYYLGEAPILPQVPTYVCAIAKDCQFVLENLSSLVVKMTNLSGGYGMVIGPHASKGQLSELRQQILANPRLYVAQPLQELTCCPTFVENSLYPCRIDLRPFILTGKSSWVLPGGLTRVALVKGSYVVNSSQGGGAKDTWVLK